MSVVDLVERCRHDSRAAYGAVALAACLTAGCASAPKIKLTEFSATVSAALNINPSVTNRASPLLVRVYELKATSAFNSADFVSFYQGDLAVLGAEMVSREEFTLQPGESRQLNKVAAPETRFIGVFAAYRDLDRAQWRSVVPLQLEQKQQIVISAQELAISASVAK